MVLTPNKTSLAQTCTVTDAAAGQFEVLLDEGAYAILGEHQGQFTITRGTEMNITDKFYYDSVDALPIV
jgi:hypothetical protein